LQLKLENKNIKVLLLDALPLARGAKCTPDFAAKQWFNILNTKLCKMPGRKETLISKKKMHQEMSHYIKNLNKIDLFDKFCPNEKCTYFAENPNIILYRDIASHSSIEGALNAASSFKKQLTNILEEY